MLAALLGDPDMGPGKEGGGGSEPSQVDWAWAGSPTPLPPRRHSRAPCFGLDGHHGFSTSSCHSSCWIFLQRQIGVRLRKPHPRKQAATSREILGCMRTKSQNEHSAKKKLVLRSPEKFRQAPGAGVKPAGVAEPSPASQAAGPCLRDWRSPLSGQPHLLLCWQSLQMGGGAQASLTLIEE